ncbi:hypothetical protein LCGC14_2564160, partial [marine sediment metagenome]
MNLTQGQQKVRKIKLPGAAAAFVSLVIPGLGQVLAGQVRRGFLLLGSLTSTLVLMSWRIHLLAHREIGVAAKLAKAFKRRPFFVGLLIVCTVFLWLWNAWDARRLTMPQKKKGVAIFVLIIVIFFALGWQISQVDLFKMVTELPDAIPPLSNVLWPWKAAVSRRTAEIKAGADILEHCDENAPGIPEEIPGEPYLMSDPTCGELSSLDEDNMAVKGSTITLTGRGFEPNMVTQIWWEDPLGNEFRPRQEGKYVSVVTDENGEFVFELIMPYRLTPPSARGPQIHRVEARQVSEVGGLIINDPLKLTLGRMAETIFMGMMATFFGIIFAIPISFLAARNLMSGTWG